MWDRLLEFGSTLIYLTRDMQDAQQEIKDLRSDLDELTLQVLRLSDELRRSREREEYLRENLALQLENHQLRIERLLPRPDQQ